MRRAGLLWGITFGLVLLAGCEANSQSGGNGGNGGNGAAGGTAGSGQGAQGGSASGGGDVGGSFAGQGGSGAGPQGSCDQTDGVDDDNDGFLDADDCNECDANVNAGAVEVIHAPRVDDGLPPR